MESKTQTMGTILADLLPQELRVDANSLTSISTDPAFTGSTNRYKKQLARARQAYSRIFFEADFAHRLPLEEALAEYYLSKRDWSQSVLQLYTSAKNARIPAKKLPFGAEFIEKLKDFNEIADVLTHRVTTEKQHRNEAGLRMQDDLAREASGLVKRVLEAAGVKSGTELPGNKGKASEGIESQRILSSDEVRLMLGNIAMTAESVAKSADGFLTQQH